MTDLRSLYGMQKSLRHQKSRIQSCKLGDRNTKFIHLSATARKKKNAILSFYVDGKTVTKHSEVKNEIVKFYKGLYAPEKCYRPSCSKLLFKKLLPSSAAVSEAPFSLDEVKAAIWE